VYKSKDFFGIFVFLYLKKINANGLKKTRINGLKRKATSPLAADIL